MANVDQHPISSDLIQMTATTELSNGQPSIVVVKLLTRTVLLPTAAEYVEANLLPEIVSRAGLVDTIIFATIAESSYQEIDPRHHSYEMQLTIDPGVVVGCY